MFIPEDIINEIAEKSRIEEVVGRYVTLKSAGKNLTGLCPFHTEKTPSFTVSPEKGLYYCHGCKTGGNVFRFVMEMEKMTFPEAAAWLADKAGVRLNVSDSREMTEEGRFRKQLSELYEKVSVSFSYILQNNSRIAGSAVQYLKDRGVTQESIEKFRLGFAPPDRYWLNRFLRKKSYSQEFLLKSGLFSSRYPEISLFSGRIIFPIFSRNNRVIAFGGRSVEDAQPKYLNSPETGIFRKSEELYGFSAAIKEIRQNDAVYVVEGYMDVIAMHQAGIENTIAPLGTSLTDRHAEIIRKNCSKVILVFDGDSAGVRATEKGAFICEKTGLTVSVIILPDNSDPADILKKEGPEALKNILKYPINCFEYLLKKYSIVYDFSKEEGIRIFLNKVFAFVSIMDSEVHRAGRLRSIAETLNADYRPVYDDFLSFLKKEEKKQKYSTAEKGISGVSAELYLMLAIIENYDYFYLIRDELSIEDIIEKNARELYIILEECYRNNSFSLENVIEKIDNSNLRNLVTGKVFSEEFTMNPKQLIQDSIKIVKLKNLSAKREQIEKQINKADQNDPYYFDELISEKLFYDKEIDKLKGTSSNVRVTE